MLKLFTVYVYLQALFCGCGADVRRSGFERLRSDYRVKIERIGRLDRSITESSGLASSSESTYWTHPDGGPLNVLQQFNLNGDLLQTLEVPVPNTDWEDLTQDDSGNLFIGDFGNNFNTRRTLNVFKLAPNSLLVTDTIRFSFKDQTQFPPPYWKRHHDVEAFFYRSDSLFLFTKSRAYKGKTRLYSLPASSGNYPLAPKAELQVKSPITSAASAPDNREYALLGYGRMYVFKPEDNKVSLDVKRYCLTVGRTGQAEAILYLSPTQMLLTNERGKLYLVTLEKKN